MLDSWIIFHYFQQKWQGLKPLIYLKNPIILSQWISKSYIYCHRVTEIFYSGGHKEYGWQYGDVEYEFTEILLRVLASHQHSIFSFLQVRLYSAYSILMSQPPYCLLWVLIAFVGRSWEKNSYSDSWIHHVHYRRSLLKIFLRKEYVL